MKRKEFITTLCYGCAAGIGMTTLLQSCGGAAHYAHGVLSDQRIAIRKSEFVYSVKGKVVERNFVVVKNERLRYPVCVYKLQDNAYSALLMECTHKGCELRPHAHYLSCPCHGSEFSNRGIVQNAPAERDLRVFTTTVDDDFIYIGIV